MTGPCCIVCGKPIAKATRTVYFKDAEKYGREHGARDAGLSTYSFDIFVTPRPRSRAEAQRLLNDQIVSIQRQGEFIYSVGVWDGESYVDRYFHAGACATKQGYASAQHGHRYRWGK